MARWLAVRLRRFAHRIDPIRPQWNGETWLPQDGYDQAWLVLETDGVSHNTTVKINGKPVQNCTAVTFNVAAGDFARVTLELEDVPVILKAHDLAVEAP